MVLSPDFKQMIKSHTVGMAYREKRTRVIMLCQTYKIENTEDLREAAAIAEIKFEEMR